MAIEIVTGGGEGRISIIMVTDKKNGILFISKTLFCNNNFGLMVNNIRNSKIWEKHKV